MFRLLLFYFFFFHFCFYELLFRKLHLRKLLNTYFTTKKGIHISNMQLSKQFLLFETYDYKHFCLFQVPFSTKS